MTELRNKRGRRTLAMFQDVRDILDQALLSGGGVVELETYGKAVHWRQRAYQFRKMYADTVESSIYDRIMMKKVEEGTGHVRIVVVGQTAVFHPVVGGQAVGQPGRAIGPKPRRPVQLAKPDEYELAANELALNLKLAEDLL